MSTQILTNRIIKFRAWHKERKILLPVTRIDWFGIKTDMFTVLVKDELNYEAEYAWMHHQIELMQSTGIFDKNGKEIFEGDIIAFRDPFLHYKRALVYFDKGSFYADDKHPAGNVTVDYLTGNNRDVEIIGNSFENPELLNN